MDVVEWFRALDVRLSEWCCSVSMVWVQIPSREEPKLTALKSNSNTVWFNFQTYIYIYIYIYAAFQYVDISFSLCIFQACAAAINYKQNPKYSCKSPELVSYTLNRLS